MSAIDLRAERLNRGLSLRAAGDAIGVAEQSIRRAEAGETVQPRTAYKIATFYGYKVTDLWPLEAAA